MHEYDKETVFFFTLLAVIIFFLVFFSTGGYLLHRYVKNKFQNQIDNIIFNGVVTDVDEDVINIEDELGDIDGIPMDDLD